MSQSLIIQKQAGNTLTIIRQGANTGGAYTLPVATDATLGGVKIGAGLSANATGTLTTNATLIGLGSVDNTSDANKPVSNATATALAGKAALVHTHVISDTTGLQTALDAKLPTANFTYANLPDTPNLSVYYLATNPSGYITSSCLTWSNTTGKPTFANVATSGLYSDLSGTPNLSLYLTVANAASTYQTIAGMSSYATLTSPALTGTPTAPTAANGTATTQLATTAFVANATANLLSNSPANTINTTGNTAGTFAGAARADHSHVLPTSGVTAGTYGSASTVAAITVDTFGRVTAASNTTIQIDAANITSGTLANARLGVAGQTLTWASPTTTWACNFLQTATLTLSGASTTLSASGHVAGGTYVLILKQDATGNRAIIWSGFKWPSGTAPVISTSANSTDILTFVSDGTSLYGVAQKAFA